MEQKDLEKPAPVKMFLLFSGNNQDVTLLAKLRKAFSILEQNHIIKVWSADMLHGGANINETTLAKLQEAEYLLALVSSDYLSDKDCIKWETKAKELGKPIIPVLLRPCLYQYNSNLSNSKLLPQNPKDTQPKPISQWKKEDDAIHTVITGLQTTIQVNKKYVTPESQSNETISTKIDALLMHYYKKINGDRLKRFDVNSIEETKKLNVEPIVFKELMLTAQEEGYINWGKTTIISLDYKYYSRVNITEKGERRINCFTLNTEGIDDTANQQHNNETTTEETNENRALPPSKRKPQNNNNMGSEYFENGYALLIGVGSDLPATVNDATALKDLLTDKSIAAFNPDKVHLLTESKATKEGILEALKQLKEQVGDNKEASIIISYAGHGYFYSENGGNIYYLQPNNLVLPTF